MRRALIVIGFVCILLGAVWTLQGLNVLLGSVMSGQPFWATMGVVLLVVGAVLCYIGWRRTAV